MRLLSAVATLLPLSLLTPSVGAEEPPATWDAFQAEHSLSCSAGPDALAVPEVRTHGAFEYAFHGPRARLRRIGTAPRKGPVKLAVLSGIKELDPATRAALEGFFARFEAEGVEALLVGGDSAEQESNLEEVFGYLADKGLPTFVVIGNWESRAPFNRALRTVSKEHPNVVNMGFVRRVDAEGFDVVSLGGYSERAYARVSGVCLYRPEDAQALVALAKEADDPVVLLMHGPPKQSGKQAIDFVPGVGNVGDEHVTAAIREGHIAFGIHGHILEAGGRATDLAGKPLKERKALPALFLNPGPASALPWKLNDGTTSYGMAAILTLESGKASFEVVRAPKPPEPADGAEGTE